MIPALDRALEQVAGRPAGLAEASERLSRALRAGQGTRTASALDAVAYACTRMPATMMATATALRHLPRDWPTSSPRVLDLGAGTGALTWAAQAVLGTTTMLAVERDPHLAKLGASLAASLDASVTWQPGDLSDSALPPAPVDLVGFGYSLGELAPAVRDRLLRQVVARNLAVVIVEPGTPRGAAVIAGARNHLLAAGYGLTAPCPHHEPCPLADFETGWCHQRVRLARTRSHRASKRASLGWEDEPFAYLAAAPTATPMCRERVVAPVHVHKGGARITTCTATGLVTHEPRRRDPAWRQARTTTWGDPWA